MQTEVYLNFDGRCEEALKFYKSKLGAEVEMMMRFKESPDQSMVTPGSGNKVMHSRFKIGDPHVMASDGRCQGSSKFQGFSLTKTFFSPKFGMLSDKFGVGWMVLVAQNNH